jgi:hypothetical protein
MYRLETTTIQTDSVLMEWQGIGPGHWGSIP